MTYERNHYSPEQTKSILKLRFVYLLVSVEGHTLKMMLNRPEKRNAMNPQFMREIAFALDHAHHNPDIRSVELSANGTLFSAGADLKAFAGDAQAPDGSEIPPSGKGRIVLSEAFRQLKKPCVCLIEGNVYAGAFLLVCGASHVLCKESVKFFLPEAQRGIWPMQVMGAMLRIMPERKVIDLCTRTGEISAQEALACGLVSRLIPDGSDMAQEGDKLLDELNALSPKAVSAGMEAMEELAEIPDEHKNAYLKGKLEELLQTEDAQEGIRAWKEKRKPKWTGK